MTCNDTTDVCPGTELTCICSVSSSGLAWRLPGSEFKTLTLAFDDKEGALVGSCKKKSTTDSTFVAVITNNTGGVLESILIYTATESLANGTIECKEEGNSQLRSVTAVITDTFAG